MKPWKTILTLAGAAFILAGSKAQGATYYSCGAGTDWDDPTNWSTTPCVGACQEAQGGFPQAGDTATVCAGDTITLDSPEGITVLNVVGTLNTGSNTLTLSKSGATYADLNVTSTGVVNVDANGKVLISGGGTGHTIESDARLYLKGAGSTLEITTRNVTITGAGAIVGQNDAARITTASGKTLTSTLGTVGITGALEIDGGGSFTNNGIVDANDGTTTGRDTLLIDVRGTLSDGSKADRWKVSANGAKLQFASTVGTISDMDGHFVMTTGNPSSEIIFDHELSTDGRLQMSVGVVKVNENVTFDADYATDSDSLDMRGEQIEVAADRTFTHN